MFRGDTGTFERLCESPKGPLKCRHLSYGFLCFFMKKQEVLKDVSGINGCLMVSRSVIWGYLWNLRSSQGDKIEAFWSCLSKRISQSDCFLDDKCCFHEGEYWSTKKCKNRRFSCFWAFLSFAKEILMLVSPFLTIWNLKSQISLVKTVQDFSWKITLFGEKYWTFSTRGTCICNLR